MRTVRILVAIVLVSSSAGAERRAARLDPGALPRACRTVAAVPADADSDRPALAAMIAAASCLAGARADRLRLAPDEPSAQALERAIRPGIALLDAVIARGDLGTRIVALHARAALYDGIAVRLLASVPRFEHATTREARDDHARIVHQVAARVAPWRTEATANHREIMRLGRVVPWIVWRDPVLAFDVTHSTLQEALAVAGG